MFGHFFSLCAFEFRRATVMKVSNQQQFIDAIITELGRYIPAFALDSHAQSDRRRYVEASLLLYEMLDQSNHAARNLGLADDNIVVEVLAERFIAYVTK